MATYPNLQELIKSNDKNSLLEVRRSVRSSMSAVMLFLFSAIAAYSLIYYLRDWSPPQDIPLVKYISVRWLVLIPAITLIELVRRYHNDLYVFSLHKLTHKRGRLAMSYAVPVIKYAHIRSVEVDQDIWGRILDYGNILVSTAAQEEVEMLIEGVRSPVELATLIEDFRTFSGTVVPEGGDQDD